MEIKDIRIGNVVRVKKDVVNKPFDLIGTIKGIYPNHVLVVDHIGLWYSIVPSDFDKMSLIEDVGFKEYDEKDYKRDIKEALLKS